MPRFTSSPSGAVAASRRAFLLAGVTGVTVVTGCLEGVVDDNDPQERAYDVTITISDGELVGSVAEAAVEDVVQVHVGDTVTFTFANETDEAVGVHDHASDAEVVIDSDGDQTMEFEVSEAMIGRQEIEAWIADEATRQDDDAHVEDATTVVIVEVRPRGS